MTSAEVARPPRLDPALPPAAPPARFAVAAVVLLAGVFALNVYRAATQSVTHDEALTWLWYLDGPLLRAFEGYMPNNHVLHTLLAWLSVHALGTSELTLRLPSLLGGLLYMACALRLCRRAFGGRWTTLLALGLLVLNPLVLDFLSAARGYGLALGFCLWSLLHLDEWLAGLRPGGALPPLHPHLTCASVGMGLSIGCHLTLTLPGVSLLLVAALAILAQRGPGAGARDKARALAVLLLPGAALAAALWLPSLLREESIRYAFGLPSLLDTSENLVFATLAQHPAPWPLRFDVPLFRAFGVLLARGVVPLLVASLMLAVLLLLDRLDAAHSTGALSPLQRLLLLAGGALVLPLLAFFGTHKLLGTYYPQDRWGLYLIVFFVLAAVALARAGWLAGGLRRAGGAALLGLLWCVLLQSALQLQAREYGIWRSDAGTRTMFSMLQARHAGQPDGSVDVLALHPFHVPSFNWYRRVHHAGWMSEVTSGFGESSLASYYVVMPGVADDWAARRLQPIYTDPSSGVQLSVRRL